MATPSFTREARYDIRLKDRPHRLEITLSGFWDVPLAVGYEKELRSCLASMPSKGTRIGDHLSLVDLTDFAVQTREVATFLQELAQDPSIAPKQAAVVNPGALLGNQVKRIAPDYYIFSTIDAAREWLLFGE